jgi:hypothetical protein
VVRVQKRLKILEGLEDCLITLQHSNDVNEGINCPDIQIQEDEKFE